MQLFLGVENEKLRFFTPEGQLVPTPEEVAETAQQQLDIERQQKEAEMQKTEKMAAKLRELGIDPEQL